jgi:phosphate transport system substrate-binding protein
VAFDAITVVVNPANTWVKSLTVADLKKMWEPSAQSRVTKWNQVRSDWPAQNLMLFGPGADSGTFDYFTEAVNGKAKASRGDFTASEDDNVLVQGIEGSKYALGYLPYAYYEPHQKKMKALAIDWEKDQEGPIKPSEQSVIEGKYNPLSRPLFLYVNKKRAERPEVKAFVDFYLTHGKELVAEVKYIPLPAQAYEMAKERFAKRQSGSGFGGVPEVGLPIEEILKREPRSSGPSPNEKNGN